ncbi:MAG: hypothetical protein ASARMPREDX12_005016 [Alectoria sarmentosa]|nr:MAG: hypothetical protein ASARMPREDX12_005016 [Alectoria sarmentosa]
MFGNSRYFGLKGTRLNVAVGVLAGLDFLLFGYDQGVMGGLLTLNSFVKTFPEIDTTATTEMAQHLNASQKTHRSTIQGISVAAYNVGCFFGAVATIFIGDRLGRRKTIFLGSSIMVVGAALQCSSFSLGQFISGRLITGRGQLVMIEGAMITGGICFSYWLDFGFSFLDPSTIAWRFPIGFQIVFALLILLFVLELPESPRWLILKGQEDEAMSVLSALSDLPPDDPYVHGEFSAIKDTVLEMSQGGFRDLFTMDENRHLHRTILAYVNQVFQQISGINLVTYYAATIYQQEIGLSGLTSRALAAANGTEYFAASWIAVFTIEKFGRRQLEEFQLSAMQDKYTGKGTGIVAALFLFIFNTFFAIGWLGMTWLYPAEIVPLRIRAPANALSTSANWAFNFMVVMITPVAFSSIKYKTYVIFAVINAFIFPVVYLFYPETAYRSLEEMDTIFRKCRSYFTLVKIARDEPRRYGKKGELLINYEETEEHARKASILSQPSEKAEKAKSLAVENESV